jgi:hypothetical protein
MPSKLFSVSQGSFSKEGANFEISDRLQTAPSRSQNGTIVARCGIAVRCDG